MMYVLGIQTKFRTCCLGSYDKETIVIGKGDRRKRRKEKKNDGSCLQTLCGRLRDKFRLPTSNTISEISNRVVFIISMGCI